MNTSPGNQVGLPLKTTLGTFSRPRLKKQRALLLTFNTLFPKAQIAKWQLTDLIETADRFISAAETSQKKISSWYLKSRTFHLNIQISGFFCKSKMPGCVVLVSWRYKVLSLKIRPLVCHSSRLDLVSDLLHSLIVSGHYSYLNVLLPAQMSLTFSVRKDQSCHLMMQYSTLLLQLSLVQDQCYLFLF